MFLLALLASGCTPIPQCHAIVNGVRYDADHTNPAWCVAFLFAGATTPCRRPHH
jgi:hypothetical protein